MPRRPFQNLQPKFTRSPLSLKRKHRRNNWPKRLCLLGRNEIGYFSRGSRKWILKRWLFLAWIFYGSSCRSFCGINAVHQVFKIYGFIPSEFWLKGPHYKFDKDGVVTNLKINFNFVSDSHTKKDADNNIQNLIIIIFLLDQNNDFVRPCTFCNKSYYDCCCFMYSGILCILFIIIMVFYPV